MNQLHILKAKDLKQKMVIVYLNRVFIVYKVTLTENSVEIETTIEGSGLIIFKPIEAILVLGEV